MRDSLPEDIQSCGIRLVISHSDCDSSPLPRPPARSLPAAREDFQAARSIRGRPPVAIPSTLPRNQRPDGRIANLFGVYKCAAEKSRASGDTSRQDRSRFRGRPDPPRIIILLSGHSSRNDVENRKKRKRTDFLEVVTVFPLFFGFCFFFANLNNLKTSHLA